ncbi:MAG: GNAT family N-acetyltransferase [Planctomycetota bacterium]
MTVQIRPATLADVDAIATVHVQAWHETYTGLIPQRILDGLSVPKRAEMWAQQLRAPTFGKNGESLWVCDDAATGIVGFVNSGPNRFTEYALTGEIQAIYLLQSHHGRGLGKQLLWRGAASLKEAGHAGFVVRVLTTNPTAGFYAAQGGTILGEYDEVLAGEALPHQVMGFTIPPRASDAGG